LDLGERRIQRFLRRPDITVRSRESRVRRLLDDRLQVEASDSRVQNDLAWDTIALAARNAGPGTGLGSWNQAAAAEASLASGDPAAVRSRIIKAFRGAEPVSVPAVATLVRYLAWTGDRTVAEVWHRLENPELDPAGAAEGGRLVAATRAELRRSARDLARPIPEEWRDPELTESAQDASLVDELMAVAGSEQGAGSAPSGWTGAVGRILQFVRRTGLTPEALQGRLTWSPVVVPGAGVRLRLRNLRIGGTVVELGYSQVGNTTRFFLEPHRGGPPLTVALDPVVAGAGVRATRVDGGPADLQVRPEAGEKRWRTPVQLVLDRMRILEVEMDSENH
jgi:hypothetical protein